MASPFRIYQCVLLIVIWIYIYVYIYTHHEDTMHEYTMNPNVISNESSPKTHMIDARKYKRKILI